MTEALYEAVNKGFDCSLPGLTFPEKKLLELCRLYNDKVGELAKKFAADPKGYDVKKKDYFISKRKFIRWMKTEKIYDRTAGHINYWVFRLTEFLGDKETRTKVSEDKWKMLLEAEDILTKS